MNNNPKKLFLSIVTPSYNQGNYIEETIKSIRTQNYPDLEHIVCDGGSTDETLDVLKKYPDIKWVSVPDRGQTHAINKGFFDMSKGEIVAWLNSDDVYAPSAIETVVEYFENHPETDAVYGKGLHIDENGTPISEWGNGPLTLERFLLTPSHLVPYFISQPSVFMRRELVESIGPLRENLFITMDYEYWLRILMAGRRVDFIDKILSYDRVHDAAKTVLYRQKTLEELRDLRNDFFSSVQSKKSSLYKLYKLKNKSLATLLVSFAYLHYKRQDFQMMFRYLAKAFVYKPSLFLHPGYIPNFIRRKVLNRF